MWRRQCLIIMNIMKNIAIVSTYPCNIKPHSPLLQKLNWLSASQLVQYHCAQMACKVISLLLPQILHEIITAADYKHEHQTRHNHQLRLPAIRTETGKRQLAYSGVKLFNEVCLNRRDREGFGAALNRCLRNEPG